MKGSQLAQTASLVVISLLQSVATLELVQAVLGLPKTASVSASQDRGRLKVCIEQGPIIVKRAEMSQNAGV